MSIAKIRARLNRGESLDDLKLEKNKKLKNDDFVNTNSKLDNELVDEPVLVLHDVKISDLKEREATRTGRDNSEELSKLDIKFMDNKLNGYKQIHYKELKKGDHFRITSNIYKQEGRKCSYMIVKDIVDGKLKCNSYKELYSDWIIDPNNKWKNYRFYYKEPVIPDGKCLKCKCEIPDMYLICIDCRLSKA